MELPFSENMIPWDPGEERICWLVLQNQNSSSSSAPKSCWLMMRSLRNSDVDPMFRISIQSSIAPEVFGKLPSGRETTSEIWKVA